jgi:menaquinol-cytochrome c reductase cytochrome b/c subunit
LAVTSTQPSQVRPRREREEELLVWPDLVFVEFICAVLFTFAFTVMSAVVNAPLINRANADVTPNPSKAPWYFLNLQELLLHMNPALAGVVVPTVFLIILAAVPYIDRSKDGQGEWFGTPKSVAITVWSMIISTVITLVLVLFDAGKHAQIFEKITGWRWPFGTDPETGENLRPGLLPDVGIVTAIWDLLTVRSIRAIQTEWKWSTDLGGLVPMLQDGPWSSGQGDGKLNWPEDFTRIPIPLNGTSWPWKWGGEHGEPPPQWYQDLPDWFTGLLPYDLNLNFPSFLVEILIPTILMTALPLLLVYALWRIRWIQTRRDVMLCLFSGFIAVFWVMTFVGAGFRGAGQELVWPWDVPRIDG